MPNHFNIETFRDGQDKPLFEIEKLSRAHGDTFVFTGLILKLDWLDSTLKSGNQNVRPHYVALTESIQFLSYRFYFELPKTTQEAYTCYNGVVNPVLLATWYLYRLNAFRGTKVPMVRIGDHARLFFGQFIINVLPSDYRDKEKEVIDLINQTKWKYLSSKIISTFTEGE